MTKKERLEHLIGYYAKGRPTAFAKLLSVAPSTVSSWLSRDTLDYDLIFAKCEMVNPEWLLTGKGEMLRSENRQDINVVDQKSVGFILDRYEALVRENEKLRSEIDLLKSGKRQSADVVSPAFIEKEIKSMQVAEKGEKYEKK